MNEFIDYVLSFYSAEEDSVYPEMAFTRTEVLEALLVYSARWPGKFYGDSLDRERVRDIVLDMREGKVIGIPVEVDRALV